VLGEPSLSCVRRDSFTRNLFEDVSARSGTGTREVTSYNASYGVLPCFLTFCRFLFRMTLNPGKRPAGPPKSRENPEIDDDGRLKGAFSRLQRPWRVLPRARSSGPGSSPEHNARPQWMMILKISSGIRAGIRSSYARSPSWFEPLYPYYYCQGPYRGAVVLGRGKLAKIEVALSNWLVELGGYQVKLLGEQLRKDGALRPRDPRGQVCFPPLRVSDQAADVAVGIDEVRAGERALKSETEKIKPAKTAGERRSRGEGNSPAWRGGGPIGG
jgi:hypothetical protein